MPRLKENRVRIQECNNGDDRKVYKVVVPSKIINRNKLEKGDIIVWEDSPAGIYIKRIVRKKDWRND